MLRLDFLITFFSAVVWCIAAQRAGRLVWETRAGKLRRRCLTLLVLTGSGLLLAAAKTVVLILLASQNWLFVEDRAMLHLPVLLFPAAAVLLFSVPKLRVLVKGRAGRETGELNETGRTALFEPSLIFPFQAAAAGSTLVFGFLLFDPQSPLDPGNALLWGVLFAVLILPLWIRLRLRRKRLDSAGLPVRRRFRARLLRGAIAAAAIAVAAAGWIAILSQTSRLPDRISMAEGSMDFGGGEYGQMRMTGGRMNHSSDAEMKTVSVTELTGPSAVPDRQIELTAQKKTVKLASGATVEAWTFNGQLPGPELRFRKGELVQVTLFNRDIEEGVTLHWHGLDVPNGEDGVAGLTQDAVLPGGSHVYRFRAEQTGTYWYHSHQMSSEQVGKGLFGSLIVDPPGAAEPGVKEITVINHEWNTSTGSAESLGVMDGLNRLPAPAGTPVRLRLINADNRPKNYHLAGVPFRVASIDGTDLIEPGELTNERLSLAAGGRYDLTFVMPERPVVLAGAPGIPSGNDAAMALLPDGNDDLPEVIDGPVFDPSAYGQPGPAPFGLNSGFDRKFTMVLDNRLGFHDGSLYFTFVINGRSFPDTPMFMVKEGELIKTTFVNRSFADHPMHLHGHKMLVLSRNGKPVTGSPWWTDTLNVGPEETYEVAFRADNPGIWMDHCHNLEHAAEGMTMHLAYEGVTTPFESGRMTINKPE